MSNAPTMLILPGDGIGAEVMVEVQRVVDWVSGASGTPFTTETDLVGGAAIDAHGAPLHDDTIGKKWSCSRTCDPPCVLTRSPMPRH